jgi:hypothetical protein
VHSYLGMQLKFDSGQIKVDMSYYLAKVLLKLSNLKEEVLPGKKNLFALRMDSSLLAEKEKHFFHTVVAKLLYLLSRRARPDIITAVGFLCTRVQAPIVEDMIKLERLMGYLLKTKSKVLVLRPSQSFKIVAYVDASFTIHNDDKYLLAEWQFFVRHKNKNVLVKVQWRLS